MFFILYSFEHSFYQNIKQKWFSEIFQHIKMISEESCDTEDWNNGYWKFRISINTILKYIKIEKISIVILFHKI